MKKEGGAKNKAEEYDFIVIGAGVSGMAAAMYGARMELKTLCLGASSSSEMPLGGVITTTNMVENYPGFAKISGAELAGKIKEHALSYGKVTMREERAESVKKEGKRFIVMTKKNEYRGKAILFATGTGWRKLDCKGGREFENRGVAYCALCDAPLYKNKVAAVIGGSDSAAKDALVLAEHAKKVYIIYRKEQIRAEPVNMKKIGEKVRSGKIEIVNNANVAEVSGDSRVRKIILDREYNGSKEIALDGVFVAMGHVALSELAAKMGVKLNDKGEIMIDHRTSETNVPGVFAAGDVADKPFKQAITGVAEGCTAAHSAFEFMKKE